MKRALVTMTLTAVCFAPLLGPSVQASPNAHRGHQSGVQIEQYGDSTSYQINGRHDGRSVGQPIPRSLEQLWTRRMGGKVSYPVIADGMVFVSVRHRGSYGTDLYALDQTTGNVAWGPVDLGGTYSVGHLTYDGGRLFALSFDAVLRAFDPLTGDVVWTTQLEVSQTSFPPTAQDGVIYVGAPSALLAVQATDGALLWATQVNGYGPPTVTADGVYGSYACGKTYRLALSGEVAWTNSTACTGGGSNTAVVHHDQLWTRMSVGDSPMILDTANGQQIGTFSSSFAPAFVRNTALTVTDGTLTAFDMSSSAATWSRDGDGGLITAPVTSGRRVFIGSSTGKVFAFNLRTGTRVWRGTAGPTICAPGEGNAKPVPGLAIGGGILAVPAQRQLTAFG